MVKSAKNIKKGYRVNFKIPAETSEKAFSLAKELNISLSEFARRALQKAIDDFEQAKLEKEIEEGCKANYEYYKQEVKLWGNIENDLPLLS